MGLNSKTSVAITSILSDCADSDVVSTCVGDSYDSIAECVVCVPEVGVDGTTVSFCEV